MKIAIFSKNSIYKYIPQIFVICLIVFLSSCSPRVVRPVAHNPAEKIAYSHEEISWRENILRAHTIPYEKIKKEQERLEKWVKEAKTNSEAFSPILISHMETLLELYDQLVLIERATMSGTPEKKSEGILQEHIALEEYLKKLSSLSQDFELTPAIAKESHTMKQAQTLEIENLPTQTISSKPSQTATSNSQASSSNAQSLPSNPKSVESKPSTMPSTNKEAITDPLKKSSEIQKDILEPKKITEKKEVEEAKTVKETITKTEVNNSTAKLESDGQAFIKPEKAEPKQVVSPNATNQYDEKLSSAQILISKKEYEKAIELIDSIPQAVSDSQAVALKQQSIDLIVQQERERLVKDFIKAQQLKDSIARLNGYIDIYIQLFNLVEKYPKASARNKAENNLKIIEQEIRKIDPSAFQTNVLLKSKILPTK